MKVKPWCEQDKPCTAFKDKIIPSYLWDMLWFGSGITDHQQTYLVEKLLKNGMPEIQKETPTFLQKMKSFSSAMVQLARSGFKRTPEKEKMGRKSICDECDQRQSDGSCFQCGCYTDLKVEFPAEECPLLKWLPIIEPGKPPQIGCGGCSKRTT